MECLLIRQPYASLISFGCKRWEFRSYPCKNLGIIGIASSRGSPLKTGSAKLNKLSRFFPRGVVLATAKIVNSFAVTNEDLKRNFKGQTQVKLHGHTFTVASEPLGEPIEDIEIAIENNSWKSYAWELDKVTPLKTPIRFREVPRFSWVNVNIEKEKEKAIKDLTSFF